ncbi:LOW QUALITY PROTEIN: germ cell nuclear acidic protein [Anableps anableps]
MNDDICKSFERVARKMGWMDEGLDSTEKKLMSMIGKTRHAGTSGAGSGRGLSETAPSESSDEDFDNYCEKIYTQNHKRSHRNPAVLQRHSDVLVVSSDDEDGFETFLQRVKTPAAKAKMRPESGSEDSLKNFIVSSSDDDFLETKSSLRAPQKINTPAGQRPFRRPLSQFNSPVFVSDSGDDDEDNVIIRSTWKTRHSKTQASAKAEKSENKEQENSSPLSPFFPSVSDFLRPPSNTSRLTASPKRTFSAPLRLDESSGSEEEFVSLLERLKRKNNLTSTHSPQQRPPRGVCKTPGCFLESLAFPGSVHGSIFKENKEELTSKLYQLYNTSVFDNKLPTNSCTWNKKMRKTAGGYCVTGQEKAGGKRYARIELSEKVCDSADRLRDTLIHEMCHACQWRINGPVRDGHGNFWKLYARKSTFVHPELPMVTRCHSYINYKFQYQCTRCQNTFFTGSVVSLLSKSLDTQRFVCALAQGQLVLLTPFKASAPTFRHVVKANYGGRQQDLAGQSHAEVMRKLSADFASKTKLSES